jgi:hypothetical protein
MPEPTGRPPARSSQSHFITATSVSAYLAHVITIFRGADVLERGAAPGHCSGVIRLPAVHQERSHRPQEGSGADPPSRSCSEVEAERHNLRVRVFEHHQAVAVHGN